MAAPPRSARPKPVTSPVGWEWPGLAEAAAWMVVVAVLLATALGWVWAWLNPKARVVKAVELLETAHAPDAATLPKDA